MWCVRVGRSVVRACWLSENSGQKCGACWLSENNGQKCGACVLVK